ncbi:nonribosomal peptide synthetase-like protein 2 [Lophium mytilinum]|uniref:Nonribosomal peptide synthetase-like protein 2 n=1 Tax=Lophium mytilinum TaxID=390894 RepID=A0A6A6R9P5_9PEZI|nr:nonribosomal peptide synthetase-like protein 2 [Lophium mytilinum]
MNQESSNLSIINPNPSHLDGPKLLHQLLDGSRGLQHFAIDFLDNGTTKRQISYQSLHTLSDALAKRLRRSLSRLNQDRPVIPVLLPQSPELYITLLAILKAGAAFCPLGLDAPEERLRFILEDVSARIVVTTPDLENHLPRGPQLEVLIVEHEIYQSHGDETLSNDTIRPTDLAYLMYTSGSTGTPKAVAVSHFAVTQSLLAHDKHIPRFSRFLQFAAPTFDVSVFEIFFPLFRRGTLVGCTRADMLNDLPRVIKDMNVDAAELTPTVVSSLLRGRQSVPSLNLLLTIGEMLTRPIVDEYGGTKARTSILWGMYGPTEAAIHCTLQTAFSSSSSVGNIGVPLETVSVLIATPLDESSAVSSDVHLVPLGKAGELIVGGPQLAMEYLNRPDITTSAFIDHPQYGRLYRTGDKAKIMPDGAIECLGRLVSGQVKLRGQRLELGEVEQVIAGLEGFRNVAAQIIDETLVAFCLVDSSSVSSQDVLQVCNRWLPSFMVPGDVVLLSTFPQLPSGKVDKRKLEADYCLRDAGLASRDHSGIMADQCEDTVSSVVQDVLHQRLDSLTPFATIGLDSLRSIQIASRLRRAGYDVDATDVLSASDIKALETRATEKRRFEQSTPFSHCSNMFKDIKDLALENLELQSHRALIADIIPCTPLQDAMLAETILHSDAYCNWIEVEMLEMHTFAEVKQFLVILAAKNEILRSGFCGVPLSAAPYAQVIWRSLDDAQIEESEHFTRHFALDSSGSLLRPLKVQVNTKGKKPRLLFQIPHYLYDGWSFDLILKDLSDLSLRRGSHSRPQFREVVQYYSSLHDSQQNNESRKYWRDQLAGYQPTPFPNLNSKSITAGSPQSFSRRSIVDLKLLKDEADELQMNPQVFFQAGLAFILSSYLASTDVVFGTVTSGRTLAITGIEDILGPCIATLPLRISLSDYATARDVLESIHQSNRAAINHCTTPLRDIKRSCGINPGISLFDVLFVWQESLESHNLENLAVKTIDSLDRLEFKLTLEITPTTNGVLYRANYDPCVVPESQVRILLSQLDDLVIHLSQHRQANPLRLDSILRNSNLSIANPRPIRQKIDYGPAHSVETWAKHAPDRPAVSFGSRSSGPSMTLQTVSYMDLNSRANKLARLLQASGFGNEELICIYMEKSIDLYVSVLAVSKLGLGYAPITPDTPVERTLWILREAGVKACISHSSCSGRIEAKDHHTVLNVDTLNFSAHSDQNIDIPYKGGNLAYAIFTSGSTGTPKGVLVTQDNLASNLKVLSQIYPVHDGSRLLQSCSQAFDVSVFEIFFTWYTGMCLCSATKDDLFHDFEGSIRQFRITHLSLTPTVAALVDPENVPEVVFLVTAGEAVTEQVRRKWAGKGLYQGYGPSETTNICTVNPNVDSHDVISNIGPPFCNTSAFVLDATGDALVPRGGVGELCFGGDQVFRGYLNLPEVTAAKIFEHPEYGRLYRSGDLGRLLPSDVILFVGRSDDQVKIRGQRVELGEISSSILDSESIHDTVSIVFENEYRVQTLVAFWVPTGLASQDFSTLPDPSDEQFASVISGTFERLESRLPSYMIPAHLIPVTRIPMTQQSKVDKRRLVAAFQSLDSQYLDQVGQHASTTTASGEWSSLERQLVNLLSSVAKVGVSRIGRNTSFFSLGLDSISAISLSRQIGEARLANVSVSRILQNPSISRLASSISADGAESKTSQRIATRKLHTIFDEEFKSDICTEFQKHGEHVERILPCTPLQQAMLSTLDSSDPSTYFNRMVFEITGEEAVLRNCWQTMTERHEILRTCFVATEEPEYAYAQIVLSPKELPWDVVDVQSENLQQRIEQYIADISPSLVSRYRPPIRWAFIKSGSARHLLFYCHHAMYDGAAVSYLLNEIEQLYRGSKLPAPVSYEPYLEELVSLDDKTAELFWSDRLRNYEPSAFPNLTVKPTSSMDVSSRGGSVSRDLTVNLDAVHEECQRMSLSLLSIMQSVWTKLLHYYLGETDICFGNVVSGRTLLVPGLERLVAPCFNTIPVRVDLTSLKSNEELAQTLQDFNVGSLPFQLTALRKIQSKACHDGGRLFDSLFILQPTRQNLDHNLWTLEEDVSQMDIPLVCEVTPTPDRNTIELTVHYHQEIAGKPEAEAIAEVFDHVLRSCVTSPSGSPIQTSGIPPRLLSVCNEDYITLQPSNGPLLISAFQQNAVLQPHKVALDFLHGSGERTKWSFRRLDEISNRISHALLFRGVQVEDVIPIHLPKSPEFYAGILGILKAGAAFAPFDPKLPEERKRFMFSELGSSVVLGTEDTASSWCKGAQVVDATEVFRFSNRTPRVPGIKSSSLAYCLYTSGSTGLPKAVAVEHRNPTQTIESSRRLIPWNSHSRLLQYAATTFDMCYYDCFLAWSFGFCLCAADQSAMLNDLSKVINTMNISLLDLTPTVAATISRSHVPSIDFLYCIGEAMLPSIINQWDSQCVNSYGPTEAAFCCTIFPTTQGIKPNIIGRPFTTTSFTVISKDGETVVPVLGVGELHIGGSQVARGYFANEELTSSRFIEFDGQRLYKTGDMVRMLADGNFEFLGRSDDQIKIRGLRVELSEISQVIKNSHEDIQAVNTQILRKSKDAKDQLVVFMVTKRPKDHSDSAVKQAARSAATAKLPAYMVPNFLIPVSDIPLSSAGKVDKRALTDIFRCDADADSELLGDEVDNEADWTSLQKEVRSVLSFLSRTPESTIRLRTTIYQLGLDSISAVQVAARLRKKEFQVSASDVLENPTCVDLASKLERSAGAPRLDLEPNGFFDTLEQTLRPLVCNSYGLRSETIESVRPCTPLQQGMISKLIQSGGTRYFNYLQLQLDKGLDISRLHSAWSATMQKHVMLRTGFATINLKRHPFAMVHYLGAEVSIPWDANEHYSDDLHEIDQWLHQSSIQVLENLHKLPWRLRIASSSDRVTMDLAMFHALYDAHSLNLILGDVSAAYRGLSTAPASSLDTVLGSIVRDRDEKTSLFWEKRTKEVNPSRFPNLSPLRVETAPSQVLSKISSRSMSDLERGCRARGITMQAAGQAAWALVLAAYTGDPKVTFGTVLSGRTFEDSETVAFPTITTVPVTYRTDQDNDALLKDIMELSSSVQKHQFTPLSEIQRIAGFPDQPLFDTIFAFQKVSTQDTTSRPWRISLEKASDDYSLSIEVEPAATTLELRITFSPHVVPVEQASLILRQLDAFLVNLIMPPSMVSLQTAPHDAVLFSITPAREPCIPSKIKLLHEFVEVNARKQPQKIALEFVQAFQSGEAVGQCWTYAELDTEGDKIASLLQSYGVKPGGMIATCFDKCPEASFAMLGVLKAGCAFVALDPSAPTARKEFILKDSGADLLLTMSSQSADLESQVTVPVVNLDDQNTRRTLKSRLKLERPITGQDTSYCLYTSGTTGTPKGCEITHENAVQAMLAFQRLFAGHWDSASRWLQFASFHFDVSVLEQYWSWSVGIRVVSAPRDLIFEDIGAAIKVLNITHIDLTPSLASILHPDDVPSLCKGVFITGGEQLKQEILDVWGPKGVIYNGYGPTEATIGVTMYPRVPENGKTSNIGPQFDNVGSYVLKPNTEIPVLRGAIGELCVSGKLVGKGYLNRDDLTKERFPWLKTFEERVYRTGDLVRILHDNSFSFCGRADDQVKLRGQRLEIGEINSVIKQASETIVDVATLVLKRPNQQKEQLVTFVATKTLSKSRKEPAILIGSCAELVPAKEACVEKLPGYMVPTHFVPITSIPLSATNKADGKKLRELYNALATEDLQHLSSLSRDQDDKWSTTERRIRDVVKDFTNSDPDAIRKSSSIFELGLDSISVIGFAKKLKEVGFTNAQASLVMKNASISRLAKAVTSRDDAGLSERAATIEARQKTAAIQHRQRGTILDALQINSSDIECISPCTPLQEGMIARSLESEQPLYFVCFQLHLSSAVDETKLRSAFEKVFASTQILRTCFVNTEDGFLQVALRKPAFPWKQIAIPNSSEVDHHLTCEKEMWWKENKVSLQRPFELVLVKLPGRAVLALHIFHALYDGGSLPMLLAALLKEYSNLGSASYGPPFQSVLPFGPLRKSEGAQSFWSKILSAAQHRPFPSLAASSQIEDVVVTRNLEGLDRFEAIRRKLQVTHQAIAQACWATVMQAHVKGAVTLGIVVSGRSIDYEGAENTIGPLFNTIPFYIQVERPDTWATLVTRCHDFNTAAVPFQHTPLRDVMKWNKRTSKEPLFDTLFVYQRADGDSSTWAHNHLWDVVDDGSTADYPLAFEVEQSQDGALKLTIVAQGHVLDYSSASRLLDEFEATLNSLLTNAESLIADARGDIFDSSDAALHPFQADRLPGIPSDPDTAYEWGLQASAIRDEIATLAGVDTVEINERTSIFELGLDSIDAIKLSSRLRRRQIEIPVSSIMRNLTVSRIAQHILSEPSNKAPLHSDGMQLQLRTLEEIFRKSSPGKQAVDHVLPVTPLQEGMVAEMLSSDFTRYFNHDTLKLGSNVDITKLRDAWDTVFQQSPILRTSLMEIDDPTLDFSFAQIASRSPALPWDETELGNENQITQLINDIRKTAARSKSPTNLFRIHFVKCPGASYLVLSLAHALYDGWSLTLLHEDVRRAYYGQYKSRPSYRKVLEQTLNASGPEANGFWQSYLSGAESVTFPRKGPSESQPDQQHRLERTSKIPLSQLISFSKKYGITLQTIGQAVWSLVLASYLHTLEVVFGSILSGRDSELTTDVLFPTMNTVAVRVFLHGTRLELLRDVQHNFASIRQYQHFPLRIAQRFAASPGKALLDTLFVYQKSPEATLDTQKPLYESIGGLSDVEYPVCTEMEIVGNDLIWRCATHNSALDDEGAAELLDRLDLVLRNVMEHPNQPVIDITSNETSICGLAPYKTQDTSALMPDHAEDEEPSNTTSSAWSATELTIREVLSAVSNIPEDEVSKSITMFHLGLDSISAIKVSSLLRKRSVNLSVGDMLRAATVEKMAKLADQRKPDAPFSTSDTDALISAALEHQNVPAVLSRAGLSTDSFENILPASAGQVYMLCNWTNTRGTLFYPGFQYRALESLTVAILHRAWDELVARNPLLRTSFFATRDVETPFLQGVLRNATSSFHDISDIEEAKRSRYIEENSTCQPYVFLFAQRSANHWLLTLKIHHALYDGVSLPILIHQLQDLCNGSVAQAHQNYAFKRALAINSTEDARKKRRSFWTSYLEGASLRHLAQPSNAASSRVEVFKPRLIENVGSLESLSRQGGLSIQSLFLAAYGKMYSALLPGTLDPKDEDLVIGLYLANRSHAIEGLPDGAAPTVNLVPLRIKTPQLTSLSDSALQIQHDIREIGTLENSAVGLWEISKWTGVRIDTFVNFLKLPAADTEAAKQPLEIQEANGGEEAWSRTVDHAEKVEGFVLAKELLDNVVRESYLHTIDVEATIRNGALDVGVFCPVELLGMEGAGKVIEDLKRELMSLLS